jgi:hypothetical protein
MSSGRVVPSWHLTCVTGVGGGWGGGGTSGIGDIRSWGEGG